MSERGCVAELAPDACASWRALLTSPAFPLALAALLAPFLASVAALGLAPLFIVVTLWALVAGRSHTPWRRVDRRLAACLTAVVAWGAVSTLWALDPLQTARTSVVLAMEFTGGMLLATLASGLPEDQRRRIAIALAVGISINLAFLAIELFTPGITPLFNNFGVPGSPGARENQLNKLSRGFTVAAVLCVPATMAVWRLGHRAWAAVLLLGTAAIVFSTHSLSAKIGLPLAAAVALATSCRPAMTARVVAACTVVVIAISPLVVRNLPPAQSVHDQYARFPSSSLHRMVIWEFTAARIAEKPLFGWGLDAARSIPGADESDIIVRHDIGDAHILYARLPLHPHHAALQWWLELGAVGTMAVAAALVIVVGIARRMANAAAPLAAFSAAMVVAMVSYGIWQSWWQGALWLMAAFIAAIFNGRPNSPPNAV